MSRFSHPSSSIRRPGPWSPGAGRKPGDQRSAAGDSVPEEQRSVFAAAYPVFSAGYRGAADDDLVSCPADAGYPHFENPACGGSLLMNVRFYWAVREILRQKRRTLLLFFVSFAAMLTVLSALTNAAAAFWQQDTFADSLAFPLETILHLDYGDMEEAYVLCLMIISYKEVPSSDNGAKVSVPDIVFGQIWSTDRTLPETDRVVKSFDKKGLAEALDFGITQLERYNKKSKAKS